jgi:hypothetical protein
VINSGTDGKCHVFRRFVWPFFSAFEVYLYLIFWGVTLFSHYSVVLKEGQITLNMWQLDSVCFGLFLTIWLSGESLCTNTLRQEKYKISMWWRRNTMVYISHEFNQLISTLISLCYSTFILISIISMTRVIYDIQIKLDNVTCTFIWAARCCLPSEDRRLPVVLCTIDVRFLRWSIKN